MLFFLKLFGGVGTKQWIILGVVVSALMYVWYLKSSNTRLESRLDKQQTINRSLNEENDILRVRVKSWTDAYHNLAGLAQKCNDAVDAMKKTSADLKIKAAEAIKKAKDDSLAVQGKIDLMALRPVNPDGDCKSSVEQVRTDLKELP